MNLRLLWARVGITIGFIVTIITLIATVGRERKKSQNTVRDIETARGIKFSREEFLKREDEILQGVMDAKANEIIERWRKRFTIGGSDD